MATEQARNIATAAWTTEANMSKDIDPELLEAFANVIDGIQKHPWLGNVSTKQLLCELEDRIARDGMAMMPNRFVAESKPTTSRTVKALSKAWFPWFKYSIKEPPTPSEPGEWIDPKPLNMPKGTPVTGHPEKATDDAAKAALWDAHCEHVRSSEKEIEQSEVKRKAIDFMVCIVLRMHLLTDMQISDAICQPVWLSREDLYILGCLNPTRLSQLRRTIAPVMQDPKLLILTMRKLSSDRFSDSLKPLVEPR